MKLILLIFYLTIATAFAPLFGATYIVGISPNYDAQDRDTVFKSVLQFVLEGASVTDEIIIYDALNLKQLTKFVVPNDKLFQQNPRARAQRFKSEIIIFRQFLANEHQHLPKMTGAIHTPEFLAFAGSQLRKPGQSMNLILIGSPFYLSVEEPTFDQNSAVPSDGHIISAGESPFSTAEIKRALEGVTVHYAYLHDNFISQFHGQRLQRFYCLFIQETGGVLATWAPEIGLAFERAKQNVKQPCLIAQLDPNDTKVEMRRVTSRSIPSWFPPTNQLALQVSSIAPQPIIITNVVIASPPQVSQVSPDSLRPSQPSEREMIGIAIYWVNECDFDLYVKPASNARELYFRRTITTEGEYFHDFRGNRNDQSDYEFVHLKPGTDLRQVRAWVNLFGGRTSSPIGIVMVHYQGRTYQTAFSLKAKIGNHGGDSDRRSKSPHWVEIDLPKLVGLSR